MHMCTYYIHRGLPCVRAVNSKFPYKYFPRLLYRNLPAWSTNHSCGLRLLLTHLLVTLQERSGSYLESVPIP